jgi:two-component system sensor histidine kinase HupT/HoxJ
MKSIRNGDFSHTLTVRTHDEIGELANVFNLMREKIEEMLQELHQHQEKLEEKVLQRTMQLKEKNRELNKANEELYLAMDAIQEAQEKLLQNEKLAIVGQMSGIVAHEVLNPVSAVSIRIETNIEQARRTLAVIEKMHDILLAAERDFHDKADKQEEIIAELRKQFPLIVKIGDSLKKNQEARLEDLYFLEKQMNRIVRIVDNLRQMSKTKKDIEPVSLNKLVNEVLEDMGDGLRKRNVQVIRELAQVPSLNADHTELYSIVSNLVRNAMQAVEKIPKTSERIITVQLIHRDDEFLELVVQDNGEGVAPEMRDSIFEPGFTSRGRKGTGLGLSFSRKIARSYHGDLVLLDREPGTGAAFQVLLPLNQENV